ncbi:endolytic transglycosylase MltG, partial [Streptomyces violaceoruber]
STKDTKIDSPYNSYQRMGLPPTPIANPGDEAMTAAINPTPGDWLYFVTVKPGDTRFTADYAEHRRNVDEFNRLQQSASKQAGAGAAK